MDNNTSKPPQSVTNKRNRSSDESSPEITVVLKKHFTEKTMPIDEEILKQALKEQSEQLMKWFSGILKEQDEKWKATNNSLNERIQFLEKKEQARERFEKRRNVVISGLDCDKTNPLKSAKEFMEAKLNIEPSNIRDIVRYIERKQIIIVEMQTTVDKWKAINNGHLLRNSNDTKKIYIRNDNTYADRQKEFNIRRKLKQYKAEGANIIRKPKGVYMVNGSAMSWSEERMDFIPTVEPFLAEKKSYSSRKPQATNAEQIQAGLL